MQLPLNDEWEYAEGGRLVYATGGGSNDGGALSIPPRTVPRYTGTQSYMG
jgi:hypothetical protein